jgi:hypothetical protein
LEVFFIKLKHMIFIMDAITYHTIATDGGSLGYGAVFYGKMCRRFGGTMPSDLLLGSEDGGNTFLRIIGELVPNDTASHPRR